MVTVSAPSAWRVILVSDTHLSPEAPEAAANWEAVLRHVHATGADAVIHLGDLTRDGAHDPAELRYGRQQLERLPVNWYAVPGNHDIGDNPSKSAPADYEIDAGRRTHWLETFGRDRWSLTLGRWTVLGLNAQLLVSGLEAEAAQWDWLGEQVGACDPGQFIALAMHKPVVASEEELSVAPVYRFVRPEARQRLAAMFRERAVRDGPALVLSGHVHQYRQQRLDGVEHLWVPTTWTVLPDSIQPVLGAKRCGILSLELTDAGSVRHEFVEPPGLRQLTLIDDVPDPYHH